MPAKCKKITQDSMQKLALSLIDFLDKKDLYDGETNIYVGDSLKITRKSINKPGEKSVQTPRGKIVFIAPYTESMPIEFYNKNTLTVTFEGDLYTEMNEFGKLHDELNKLFKPYNLYLEMGTSWEFSLYER